MQPDPSMIELPPLPPPSTWEGCELHEDYCASEDSWDRDAMRSYGEACARAALEAAAQHLDQLAASWHGVMIDDDVIGRKCAEYIRELKVTRHD
jgi:hypothetical protein